MGNDLVRGFEEKPKAMEVSLIEDFILSPKVLDVDGQDCVWEQEPLTRLAEMGELKAFNHEGFWQPMDTLRDKILLEELWKTGKAHGNNGKNMINDKFWKGKSIFDWPYWLQGSWISLWLQKSALLRSILWMLTQSLVFSFQVLLLQGWNL